jgi:hypothetical protein
METTQDNITTQAITEAAEAAKPNPLERRIDMTVAMTEIEQEVEQQLRKIAKTTKLAGFRPGKVPMKMVTQMYGGQARSEALGAAIERHLARRCANRICAWPVSRASSPKGLRTRARWRLPQSSKCFRNSR